VKFIEDLVLRLTAEKRIEGPLKLEKDLFSLFLSLPEDPFPGFTGPVPGLRGRSKDHPRYGRWMHAFTRFYKPDIVVELGTNAGGTAVGIARALTENGNGRLICVDNGEGRPVSFPGTAGKNIKAAGLEDKRFELICEDSKTAIPRLMPQLEKRVGIYLVDAEHTFGATLANIKNGLPLMKPGGFILVHDVDTKLSLGAEASGDHPQPVYEAFRKIAEERGFQWCILKFIRKHLGILRIY